ncbi:MAG: SH3 domain-containing protein [Candidatus Wallbacteria bacterium]|nr:SH3 domain-containing protein [Candidatus Wallbacteria bacterium]
MRAPWLVAALAAAILAAPQASAQDAETFAKANQAYRSGDFRAALEGYRKLAARVANPALDLNLGNAAFKSGEIGWAIVYFERGLRLEPRHEDLAANLTFVRERIVDRTGDEGTGAAAALERVYRWLSLRELLVLASIFWTLTLGTGAAMFWMEVPISWAVTAIFNLMELPRSGKIAALFAPCLAGLIFFGGWAATRLHDESVPRAIVLEKEVKAASGPGADQTIVFAVHEGTKVTVLRRSDRWAQVSLPNGYSGWVPEGSIEEI